MDKNREITDEERIRAERIGEDLEKYMYKLNELLKQGLDNKDSLTLKQLMIVDLGKQMEEGMRKVMGDKAFENGMKVLHEFYKMQGIKMNHIAIQQENFQEVKRKILDDDKDPYPKGRVS